MSIFELRITFRGRVWGYVSHITEKSFYHKVIKGKINDRIKLFTSCDICKAKAHKKLTVLSFGDEAEEEEKQAETVNKGDFSRVRNFNI